MCLAVRPPQISPSTLASEALFYNMAALNAPREVPFIIAGLWRFSSKGTCRTQSEAEGLLCTAWSSHCASCNYTLCICKGEQGPSLGQMPGRLREHWVNRGTQCSAVTKKSLSRPVRSDPCMSKQFAVSVKVHFHSPVFFSSFLSFVELLLTVHSDYSVSISH